MSKQIFLTYAQAVDAVAGDFTQYHTQPDLFSEIAGLILKNDFVPGLKESGSIESGPKIRKNNGLIPVDYPQLGFYLVHLMESRVLPGEVLAEICTRVFETPVIQGISDGGAGLWVSDQMEGFHCRRCGNCCIELRAVAEQEDVQRWQALGRRDILAWISDTGHICHPDTGDLPGACPFLGQTPGGCFCGIQEVKPQVCRDYPMTRKHARMTGCSGFQEERPLPLYC